MLGLLEPSFERSRFRGGVMYFCAFGTKTTDIIANFLKGSDSSVVQIKWAVPNL